MTAREKTLVIDASVAVKLFIEEELTGEAERIFQTADEAGTPLLLVPDLFFIECANVFRSKVKMREMSADDAERALALLFKMPLECLPSRGLSEKALKLAILYDLSVYDGCYLALAIMTGSILITADKKLVRKLDGSDLKVRWLGRQIF